MDNVIVIHTYPNSRYKVVFERSASSTKGIDGFKVEANGDEIAQVEKEASELYTYAQIKTSPEVLNG